MSDRSAIEWTEATWNPVRGCSKVSAGCKHCYAETFSERFRGVPGHPFEQGFDVRLVPEALELPLRWRRPRMIFVNSMSDLFHEDVPLKFIQQVFGVMERASQHQFQVLTKRSKRLVELSGDVPWPTNIWMGVSVENADFTWRVRDLQRVPASVRFVSAEPLLGPIPRLPLRGMHWVIVGGESGNKARPMSVTWVQSIRRQCEFRGVPFFFKQWGGRNKKAAGRLLDGKEWNAMPLSSQIS
ncbi:MAG: hypothetical protein A2289_11690 [Deltaproteobacteria bacterium RIFOXYA12_FULL_58_15]|nr:MAG: hypothetical protein A2289_11690 [Deltaproteobacteria bacterium RIFOXYA12_FULL_58_15]OGR14503.1 MAG: hypothetical protein A2341_24675 [Deltaproteobacteria bacterium RIFOXYB12_FULL_58_9]